MSSAASNDHAPQPLRAAVGLWCAMAVFLLVQAGLSWTEQEQIQRRLIEHGAGSPAQAASAALSMLLVNTVLAVVLAVLYGGLAVLMAKRHAWARIALTAVAVVHVVVVLGQGAPGAANLIAFALGGAALVCCWVGASSEWLTGERD